VGDHCADSNIMNTVTVTCYIHFIIMTENDKKVQAYPGRGQN